MKRRVSTAGVACLVLAGALVACFHQRHFACTTDAECRSYRTSGLCEPDAQADLGPFLGTGNTGVCSFGDDACPSGHRYEPFAPGALAGQCLPCGDANDYCCTAQPACSASLACGGTRCTCLADIQSGFASQSAQGTSQPDGHCVVTVAGALRCDGTTVLADGTQTVLPTATALTGFPIVRRATINTPEASCVLDAAGATRCWHLGRPLTTTLLPPSQDIVTYDYNQLDENGTNLSTTECYLTLAGEVGCMEVSATTVPAPKLTGVVRLRAAPLGYHACAVKADGSLWCFEGREGPGSFGTAYLYAADPVEVTGLGPVKDVTLDGNSTCALLVDGSVWCWGVNSQFGGDGGFGSGSAVPVRVDGVSDAVQVALGGGAYCALLRSGVVSCWHSAQLTNGVDIAQPTPLTALPGGIDRIFVDGDGVCASRGTDVYCAQRDIKQSQETFVAYPLTCP